MACSSIRATLLFMMGLYLTECLARRDGEDGIHCTEQTAGCLADELEPQNTRAPEVMDEDSPTEEPLVKSNHSVESQIGLRSGIGYLTPSHLGPLSFQRPLPGRFPAAGIIASTPKSPPSLATSFNSNDLRTLLPTECGYAERNITKGVLLIIFGGRDARPYEYPWIAALEYDTPKGIQVNCGGSLITNQHVLTAAHCIVGRGLGLDRGHHLRAVRLGEWDRTTDVDCFSPYEPCKPRHITVTIDEEIVHEHFNQDISKLANDIGILKLSQTVKFTEAVQPICLPTGPELASGFSFQVAGWGRAEHTKRPAKLRTVPLEQSNRRNCELAYSYQYVRLNPSQICVGGSARQDSCHGDSGGPLMQSVEQPGDATSYKLRKYIVVGIVSFGHHMCAAEHYPAIYTKVYDYLPWILGKIKGSKGPNNRGFGNQNYPIYDKARSESTDPIFPSWDDAWIRTAGLS